MHAPIRFTTIVLVALSASFCELRTARAQDIYNFYFQKAPGPQTVIQGAPESSADAPLETPGTSTDTSTQLSATAASERVSRSGLSKWWFSGGIGSARAGGITDSRFLGGDYRFNKFVGVSAQVLYTAEDVFTRYQNSTELGVWDRLDANIGLVVTPLHFDLFGKEFLSVSLNAGLATAWRERVLTEGRINLRSDGSSSFTYDYVDRAVRLERSRDVEFFTGATFTYTFSKDLAIRIDTRKLGKSRADQVFIGWALRI